MKKYFIILILICATKIVDAQNTRLDSLLIELSTAKADINKVNLLNKVSQIYRSKSMSDSALLFASEGLDLAKSIHYKKGEISSSLFLSRLLWLRGDYTTGLRYSLPIYEYAKEINDSSLIRSSGNTVFHNYRDMGEYRKALDMLFEGSTALTNANENLSRHSKLYAVAASCYYGLEKYDSAYLYLQKSFLNPNRKKDGWSLLIAGRTEVKLNHVDKAFDYYRQSIKYLSLLKTDNNYKDLASAYGNIATLFEMEGNVDSAIYYGKMGLDIAQQKDNNKERMEAYFILSKAYEQVNTVEALRYLKLSLDVKDSLFSVEKQRQFASYTFNEQIRRNELKASEREHKNKIRTNTLAGSLFTLFIIAIFLYRNSRLKQRAKQKIEHAFDQLKSTQAQLVQSEKMASLGELTAGIAHEIQNPLNFVNNFSELNTELISEFEEERQKEMRDFENEDEILKDLKENEQKISHHGKRAEAIVKGMLQHSRTSSGQKELTDLNVLVDEYLRLSYHGLRAKDQSFNADFNLQLDENLPKIEVVPQDIGRVFLNLINNAFYAVAERSKKENSEFNPMVEIRTLKIGDNKVEIRVKDNGNGMPDAVKDKIFQPFFTTKPTGSGTGLGLSLSYDIVNAHGGELKVETKEGEGTEFVITLPTNV